jgi:hypothetical protein
MLASSIEEMAANRTRKNRNNAMMGGFKSTVGSKREVFNGTAKHTSGGLYKKDLMKTKKGRIVSKRKHSAGLKAIKRLRKAGYTAKKGQFKLFSKKGTRRGGAEDMSGNMMDVSGSVMGFKAL